MLLLEVLLLLLLTLEITLEELEDDS